MRTNSLGRLLVGTTALMLSACGGGGGRVASTPTPPPTATPTPTSSPSAIFPSVTSSTQFAALGLETRSAAWRGGGPVDPTGSPPTTGGVSVAFDAASNSYVITPLYDGVSDHLNPDGSDSSFWYDQLDGSNTAVAVFKPSSFQLSYTSFVASRSTFGFDCDANGCINVDRILGYTAFGVATPTAGIPLSGSATYNAYVAGTTLDYPANVPSITGSATLQFNFGTGTLAGHFDPIYAGNISLGTYSFVNTLFGAGSTNFSGSLSQSGTTAGTFNGMFTGPAAQELMARWNASYLNPSTQQSGQMFGVWVGKKCC